jgi:hypothetical protein
VYGETFADDTNVETLASTILLRLPLSIWWWKRLKSAVYAPNSFSLLVSGEMVVFPEAGGWLFIDMDLQVSGRIRIIG